MYRIGEIEPSHFAGSACHSPFNFLSNVYEIVMRLPKRSALGGKTCSTMTWHFSSHSHSALLLQVHQLCPAHGFHHSFISSSSSSCTFMSHPLLSCSPEFLHCKVLIRGSVMPSREDRVTESSLRLPDQRNHRFSPFSLTPTSSMRQIKISTTLRAALLSLLTFRIYLEVSIFNAVSGRLSFFVALFRDVVYIRLFL